MKTCLKCGHKFRGDVCDKCGWEYKSISELKVAADAGDAESQYELGQAYFFGEGVCKDEAEGVKWFMKAAEQNHTQSIANLARCYINGVGVEKNQEKGIKYVKILAERGDWDSQQYLTFLNQKQKAEDGDMQAQVQLAKKYIKGEWVERSYSEAFNWAMMAAVEGNAEAQSIVGHIYYLGAEKIERNYEKAAFWLTKAAKQGWGDAQWLLSICYISGRGVKEDDEEAFKWSMKVAEQGKRAAIYNVALAYKYGIGVKPDFGKAVEWFSRGIPNDYAEINDLGKCYHKGNDDEKKCPNCGKEIEKFDYYCGLTGEDSEWSDLRHAAPQALVPSLVQMCPHCGNLFTMNLEPISIPESHGVNFINHIEWPGLIRGAFRYCSPVSEFKWDNPEQEFNQRMLFLWAYNDYFYRNESEHPEPNEMIKLMHHYNIMELLKFIENPLSQCDYLRMAGDFDKCISRVEAIMPYVVAESVPMLELVKQKAQKKDSAPFKLSELQAD